MAAAAAPYVAWMNTTAAQAEETGSQAKAAVAAYEAAFAATVPPPVIEANRALLMMLIATNILGQNTPAIAATEAHYMEMWAQDATAMYAYAGSSATASQLAPFTEPPQTTNTAGTRSAIGRGDPGHQHLERVEHRHAAGPVDQLAADRAAKPGNGPHGVADDGVGEPVVRTFVAAISLGVAASGTPDRPEQLEHHLFDHRLRAVLPPGVDFHTRWPVPVVRAGIRLGPKRAGRRCLARRRKAHYRGVGPAGGRVGDATC